MLIRVINGTPGSGKSFKARQEIAETKGRYVMACPRVDLIKERHNELKGDAQRHGTNPVIVEIHSANPVLRKRTVTKEIADAVQDYAHTPHVILLITHEGMMAADMTGFAGWHIYIDEPPNAVWSASFSAPAAATYLKANFDLKWDAELGLSRVTLKRGGASLRAVLRDKSLQSNLQTITKKARSRQLTCH